jgi:pimeloyl-ACP methyl ester carboxylesterase
VAARGHRVAAVIAEHPLMSGWGAITSLSPSSALRDVIPSQFGRLHYVPVVGRHGELAALTVAEAWNGMEKLKAIAAGPWETKLLARVLLKIPRYSPIRSAREVRAPTLVIAGSNDNIVSAAVAHKAASRMQNAEFTLHASDHFQPYYGDFLDKNVREQFALLQKHVVT